MFVKRHFRRYCAILNGCFFVRLSNEDAKSWRYPAAGAVQRDQVLLGDSMLSKDVAVSVLQVKMRGVSEILLPEHFAVANAIGAALSQVSGNLDSVDDNVIEQRAQRAKRDLPAGATQVVTFLFASAFSKLPCSPGRFLFLFVSFSWTAVVCVADLSVKGRGRGE